MSNRRRRHFIAGAVCPNCQAMDKIFVHKIAGTSYAECVRCGFKQSSANDNKQAPEPTSKAAKKVIWLKSDNSAK